MTSPSSISGLQLWIDPNSSSSYTLSSESTLTSITDTVGGYMYDGLAFIQSNAFGSRSALGFYTSNYLFNSTLSFPNTSYSIFAMAKLFSTSTYNSPRQVFASVENFTLSLESYNSEIFIRNGFGGWNNYSNVPYRTADGIWTILQLICDGTSNFPYVTNLPQNSFSGQTAPTSSTLIGSAWNGLIGDILIYNRALNSQERESVVSYLTTSWNLQPPSTPQITIRPVAVPNELRFWWNPPSFTGSGIVSYFLDCSSPILSTFYLSSSTRIYTVPGLSNGVNYQFTLTAANESGYGPAASFRSVQPGSKPSSLVSVSYSLIPPNAVLVKWNEPVADPSIIRNVVSFYPTDSNENILPQLSTSISYGTTYKSIYEKMVYLSNVNCNYKFIARQVNDAGWSPNDPFRYIRLSYSSFSPSSIAQNYLWLETQRITSYSLSTNNINVISINDLGSNAFRFNSNALGLDNYPDLSNAVNGINTISFSTSVNGMSQQTVLSSITNLFWVGKQGYYTNRNGLLGHPSNRYWDGASNLYILPGISPSGLTDADATLYLSREIPLQRAFSSINLAPTDRSFLLHVQNITGPTDFTGICFTSNVSNGSAGWRGDFCEAIAFTSSLNSSEISSVTGYLTSKWGLYQQPLFTPASAPGLFLWLDASSPSFYDLSGGTDVIRLKDRSYNNNDMYQIHRIDSNGTPTFAWPTLGHPINNISTISFQNLYSALKQPKELNGVKHFFWVGRQNSSNINPTLLGHSNTIDWHSFQNFFISESEAAPGIATAPAIRYVASGEYLYRSTSAYIPIPTNNDVFLLSINNITGNTRFNGICYGKSNETGWQGDFAECLCYNQSLSWEQQQQIETYLRTKWAIFT